MIVIGTQVGDPLPLREKLKNLQGILREQDGIVMVGVGAQEVVHEAYRQLTASMDSGRFPSELKVFEGLGLWRCLRDRKMDGFGDIGPIVARIAAADVGTMIELLGGGRSASPARSQWNMDGFGDVAPIPARIAPADVETMIELPARRSASPARSQWNKNQDRDRIILNCLDRAMAREMVCDELDKRTISTLPGLGKKGLHTWNGAWQEPVGRQAIQQLFSKLPKRQKAVKPLDVSE